MKKQGMSRRSFLKTGSSLAAASTLTPAIISLTPQTIAAAPSPLNKWPGRVVINYNNKHSTPINNPIGGIAADQTTLRTMVDDAIKMLTGQTTVGAAWASLFPTLTTSTKIAVKVNFNYNSQNPPHPFVVMGITEGLKQMMVGGSAFPAGNIYMYEANGGGSFDGAGFTATRFPSPIHRTQPDTLSSHSDKPGANGYAYANTLYNCDYLINVPGIRGHSSVYGGVTMGFKSHFGTYSPNHSGSYPEYHRDINCIGPVYDKTVLTVFGAIFALNENNGPGGSANNFNTYAKTMDPAVPAGRYNADTVIMSTDPVTAEFQGIKVQKVNLGLSYALASLPTYLRASGGATGALPTVYNIGILPETQMRVGKIINGVIIGWTGAEGGFALPQTPAMKLSVLPNPVHSIAHFEFQLSEGLIGKKAQVEVYDMRGRLAWSTKTTVLGVRNTVAWNRRDVRGRALASGKYIAYVKVGNEVLKSIFTLV